MPEHGTYACPNRAHGFRFKFGIDGFNVEPRKPDSENDWSVTLSLAEEKDKGRFLGADVREHKLEVEKPGLVIQYINNEEGMRQNFIVEAKRGSGPLTVKLEVTSRGVSPRFLADEGAVGFFNAAGVELLRYRDLKAWDSTGRMLPSRMEADAEIIALKVDDSEAVYPVTVDPITMEWYNYGANTGDQFGFSLATGTTFRKENGHGAGLVVGAPNFDNGGSDRGAVYVFYSDQAEPDTSPTWYAYGNQDGAMFGYSVTTADVNGDDKADLVVGEPGRDYPPDSDLGAIYVWHGDVTSGDLAVPSGGLPSSPTYATTTRYGQQGGAQMGHSVSGAGKVSSSTYESVITGAPYWSYDGSHMYAGAIMQFQGSSTGLGSSPNYFYGTSSGGQAGEHFGWSLAGGLEYRINTGDSFDDIIVGAPDYDSTQSDRGRVYIFHGSSSGFPTTATTTITGPAQAGARFGHSVAMANIDNNNGFDIVVGAPNYNGTAGNDTGAAYAHLSNGSTISTSANWSAEASAAGDQFGYSVAAGKVTSTDYSDVLVGAPYDDTTISNRGRVNLYQGSSTGVSSSYYWYGMDGQGSNANYGKCIIVVTDLIYLNHDGFVISAPGEAPTGLSARGIVRLYDFVP